MTYRESDNEKDPSWWEQHVTRPLRRSFGTAPLEEKAAVASEIQTTDRHQHGTQPLESAPSEETPPAEAGDSETLDLDSTQPLAVEQVPTTLDFDSTRPLDAAQIPATLDLDSTRPLDPSQVPQAAAPPIIAFPIPTHQPGIIAATLRDIGRTRSVNQDSVYALTSSIPREEIDMLMGLFVVADGMGGHAAGEVASRIAITTVARHILAELVLPAIEEQFGASLQEVVTGAVQAANSAIWDYASANGLDMGTTCTVALILGRTIYIGHVGDSRAYVLEQGMLNQLTTDHSAVGRLIQIGALTPEESREHPLRSQLYRTIGQTAEVQVDFVQHPIGSASHLLLCSDGLWSMVEDIDLATVLANTEWPQDACAKLIDLANEAGGEDNISALVVRL